MSTTPYLPDAEDLLTSDQAHIARAVLSHPDFDPIPVPIPAGSTAVVTFDENRAPRVEAALSVPLVDVDAVDARAGWRLELEAGYLRQDGIEDVHPLADLGVRKTPRRHAQALLEIAAMSDEALVIDAAPAVAETLTAPTPPAAVTALLAKCLSPAPYVPDNLTAAGAVTIDPLEDRWAALVDLVDRYGCQVYDDGLRTWHVLPQPTWPATPSLVLRSGEGGNVLTDDEDVDRDAWANYVLLAYRWRTAAGADAQIVATSYVTNGPYAITGPAGRRIYRDVREVATTQAEANYAAQSVLRRQLSRAETTTVRAIAAYWLRPGDTVRRISPPGRVDDLIVSRVSFDLGAGTMDVQTRRPANVGTALDTTTPPPDPSTPTTPKPPTADPAPPQTLAYVSEWAASSTTTWRSNGTKRTDVAAGDLWQGMFSGSFNGNQRSLAMFTGANSTPAPGKRGETGKTIGQALTGAKISRVEVVAKVEHTWAEPPRGADIRIGYLDVTAVPSSLPAMRPYVTSNDWTKGTTRTVNVTSPGLVRDLLDGSARGLTFGPGASSATDYYARLSAIRVRIHYSK